MSSLAPISMPACTKLNRASLPARGLSWTVRCWRTGSASYSSSVAQCLTQAIIVTVITVNCMKYLPPCSVLCDTRMISFPPLTTLEISAIVNFILQMSILRFRGVKECVKVTQLFGGGARIGIQVSEHRALVLH